jgi:serine/threonine protein phosphatase 1
MPEPEKFAVLRAARRIWAISPVHGDMARLRALHGYVAEQFREGDRLIYLGGMLGRGSDVEGVMDELVSFAARSSRARACSPSTSPICAASRK